MELLAWFKAIGAASTLIGGVALMQDPDYFWWAVGFVYAGLALLALDLIMEPFFQQWSLLSKSLTVGVIATGIAAFSYVVVFVKAPLEVSWTALNASYPDGTVRSGIDWRPEFGELNIRIRNPTNKDYSDLDIVIKPDQPVAAITHVSGCPSISFEHKYGATISTAVIRNGQAIGNPLVLTASDSGYRFRCERLSRNSSVQILMAVATMKINPPGPPTPFADTYWLKQSLEDGTNVWYAHDGGNVFGPRPDVSAVMVEGEYVAAQRRRKVSLSLRQ